MARLTLFGIVVGMLLGEGGVTSAQTPGTQTTVPTPPKPMVKPGQPAGLPPEVQAEMAKILAKRRAAREECAWTFPERLAKARQALREYPELVRRYTRDYDRVMPWFDAHCHMQNKYFEKARRIHDIPQRLQMLRFGRIVKVPPSWPVPGLDEFNVFLCDTQQGRPAMLTGVFILEHPMEPPPSLFEVQGRAAVDSRCATDDPISLDLAHTTWLPDAGNERKLADQVKALISSALPGVAAASAGWERKDEAEADHVLTQVHRLMQELDILCLGVASQSCHRAKATVDSTAARRKELEIIARGNVVPA